MDKQKERWSSAPAFLVRLQIRTHPHLPSHGRNKHVALETATEGASALLQGFSKSANSNVLALKDSRHVRNHTFSFL